MITSSPTETKKSVRARSVGHLIQWHLYPEDETWKVVIERGRERLVSATSASHFAARSFVVRARELLLGRGEGPVPPAVPWAQFTESCAISRRIDRGQMLQLTVEDQGPDPRSPCPFRFRWKVEQLSVAVLAEGRASSFLQAELLAVAAAETLPSGFHRRPLSTRSDWPGEILER